MSEHQAKIAALARQQAQKEAERATTAATIEKLEALIPVIQPRVDMRKTLMDKDLGSKLTYYETLQLLVEQQKELTVQKSHLQEAEAAVAAIRETRRQAEAEYRHTLSDELAKAEQKASGLAQELIKAEQKTRLQQLDGAGGRHGAAARDPHGRRRRHARAGPAGGGAERQPAGNRGHGLEPRHRLRPSRTGRPRSRSTPSISPVTASCTARC